MKTEEWECKTCDAATPCIVKIMYSDKGLPDNLKGNTRFRKRGVCLCNENLLPDWKEVECETSP